MSNGLWSRNDDHTAPALPAEVYGTIAEFLAGGHAFGSLAALNAVNHDAHHGSLPVLLETLLCDDDLGLDFAAALRSGEEGVPFGVRFTKFLVRREDDAFTTQSIDTLRTTFPRLSMIVTIGDWSAKIPTAVRIRLLRPLRRSTVFRIICNTPLYHAELGRRHLCPPSKLREVSVCAEGRLLPDDDASDSSHTPAALQFHDIAFRSVSPGSAKSGDQVDTIIELMKEVGEQMQQLARRQPGRIYSASTSFHALLGDFHLVLVLAEAELTALVEKMSQVAATCPGVLLPRVRFFMRETPSEQFVATVLARLRAVHETHLPHRQLFRAKALVRLYTVKGLRAAWSKSVDQWSAFEDEEEDESIVDNGYAGHLSIRIALSAWRFIVKTALPESLDDWEYFRAEDGDEESSDDEEESGTVYDESSEASAQGDADVYA